MANYQPYTDYVQPEMVDGQFVSAAFCQVSAGPPRLDNLGGDLGVALGSAAPAKLFYNIGVLQSWSVSHNKNFSRIFEIGSERSYFIPGRTMGQLMLGRVLYHGKTLLRTMYAYYQDLLPPTIIPALYKSAGGQNANPHNVIIPPGYENVFLNLASDLFNNPIGLLWQLRDSNLDTLGAIYFEACNVPSHTISTDSQGVILQEQASLNFERAMPVATKVVSLASTFIA